MLGIFTNSRKDILLFGSTERIEGTVAEFDGENFNEVYYLGRNNQVESIHELENKHLVITCSIVDINFKDFIITTLSPDVEIVSRVTLKGTSDKNVYKIIEVNEK